MAISNTSILIKRSLTTGKPLTLNQGEFAYSYASNTLFFGTPDGNGVVNVGGQYYTSTLDASTSSNNATTLVKRDGSGAFFGRLYGLSNSAITLNTARNFSVSGSDITASAQSFDGSADVTLNASLNSVPGLSAGYYGGSTSSSSTIPVVQVAANGRIMSIANTTVTSSFNISDGTTSSQVQSGNTFFHLGTKGIVATVSQNTVTISTDTTVLRSNTTGASQVINTDLAITGNLSVYGNTYTVSVVDYKVDDPMIYLAGNNYSSDIVNIGFAANYFDGTNQRHTGFFRDSTDKRYYLFDNYEPELSGNNQIDKANTTFRVATLTANLTTSTITSSNVTNSTITGGTISGLASDLTVGDGGTGVSTFNAGQIIIGGGGTQPLTQIANVTTAVTGSLGTAKTITSITTDAWGRLTAYTGSDISNLTVAQGGTGVATFSSGQLIVGNGTGALQALANTGTAGSYGSASYVPVVTTDAWGRVSSVANTQIAIDASAITTGILGVPRGGTGLSTATTNGIIFGNGTGALGVTALAGSGSDLTYSNQILTVNNSGVPQWTTSLDGGVF